MQFNRVIELVNPLLITVERGYLLQNNGRLKKSNKGLQMEEERRLIT